VSTDNLTDIYKDSFGVFVTPGVYTTELTEKEVSRAALLKSQAELAKVFHGARRESIKYLGELDSQVTETAVALSDKAVSISDQRARAQERILPNQVKIQINNTRVNAMKSAYAQGLR
jgi:hypothetical protein